MTRNGPGHRDPIWPTVDAARDWLDRSNGTEPLELTCRILKVTEEAGEAAQAWIGALGQNPRKGVTHTREQVVAELADVAFTALVALASLGADPHTALADCAAKLNARLTPGTPATQADGRPLPGEPAEYRLGDDTAAR